VELHTLTYQARQHDVSYVSALGNTHYSKLHDTNVKFVTNDTCFFRVGHTLIMPSHGALWLKRPF
jgi:hypothetical protein